jgi:hypothetical protein
VGKLVDLREAVAVLMSEGDENALRSFTRLTPTAAAHEVIRREPPTPIRMRNDG